MSLEVNGPTGLCFQLDNFARMPFKMKTEGTL